MCCARPQVKTAEDTPTTMEFRTQLNIIEAWMVNAIRCWHCR